MIARHLSGLQSFAAEGLMLPVPSCPQLSSDGVGTGRELVNIDVATYVIEVFQPQTMNVMTVSSYVCFFIAVVEHPLAAGTCRFDKRAAAERSKDGLGDVRAMSARVFHWFTAFNIGGGEAATFGYSP